MFDEYTKSLVTNPPEDYLDVTWFKVIFIILFDSPSFVISPENPLIPIDIELGNVSPLKLVMQD